MPPSFIRRPVTVTVWLVVSAACVVASPLLLALGMAASALTRRRQPAVVTRLAVSYFAHELGALVACGVLWLLAGAGWRVQIAAGRPLPLVRAACRQVWHTTCQC